MTHEERLRRLQILSDKILRFCKEAEARKHRGNGVVKQGQAGAAKTVKSLADVAKLLKRQQRSISALQKAVAASKPGWGSTIWKGVAVPAVAATIGAGTSALSRGVASTYVDLMKQLLTYALFAGPPAAAVALAWALAAARSPKKEEQEELVSAVERLSQEAGAEAVKEKTEKPTPKKKKKRKEPLATTEVPPAKEEAQEQPQFGYESHSPIAEAMRDELPAASIPTSNIPWQQDMRI